MPRRAEIIEADRATQIENCAVWHMQQQDLCWSEGKARDAERHDRIALDLFRQARAVRDG